MPFIFGGISDSVTSIFEKDLVSGVGFGFKPVHRTARDVLGIAAGWGKLANDTLQEHYTSEIFYRFM